MVIVLVALRGRLADGPDSAGWVTVRLWLAEAHPLHQFPSFPNRLHHFSLMHALPRTSTFVKSSFFSSRSPYLYSQLDEKVRPRNVTGLSLPSLSFQLHTSHAPCSTRLAITKLFDAKQYSCSQNTCVTSVSTGRCEQYCDMYMPQRSSVKYMPRYSNFRYL